MEGLIGAWQFLVQHPERMVSLTLEHLQMVGVACVIAVVLGVPLGIYIAGKGRENMADTVLYLYYGDLGVSDQQDAINVWDANFAGVWHLDEEQVGVSNPAVYQDSTANINHGDDEVSASGQTGQVNGGQGGKCFSVFDKFTVSNLGDYISIKIMLDD